MTNLIVQVDQIKEPRLGEVVPELDRRFLNLESLIGSRESADFIDLKRKCQNEKINEIFKMKKGIFSTARQFATIGH